MITVTEAMEAFALYEDFFSVQPSDCLFFDIETTGLSAASSAVFLIGAISFDEDGWSLTQWFAETPEEEPAILEAFFEKARPHPVLIHFNGTTFDLPYLDARARIHSLVNPLPGKLSVDLYQKFRPLKSLLGAERMNQISLEQCLGWQREDRLTGRQMITLYKSCCASGEPKLRSLLLLHNHDDMTGMTKILPLAAFFLMRDGKIHAATAGADDHELRISFTLDQPLPLPYASSAPHFSLSVTGSSGSLILPFFTGELRYFFADYKNYYYLPLEDQAIHKSVGAYVDKEHRTPARPATCYIRKCARFLAQPEKIFEPEFRKEYADTQLYFEYPETGLSPKRLKLLVQAILKSCFQT